MTPQLISHVITEDIRCHNGLLTEAEQLLVFLEAVSYLELAHMAEKLPKGGQADQSVIQDLRDVLGDAVGFANMIQAQTGKMPNNLDNLLKAYDAVFAALGSQSRVRPKQMQMNLNQAQEYWTQLIGRLRKATSNLSVTAKFADLREKAVFSRFINTFAERLGEASG